ncbi:MAG: TRAP transporter substrate-binding protein DctP [Proteobacteria bacterium]|nr:TRAP transporter substrate-binding protein DctP [Pseudomonadota bacterium]
MTTRNSSFRIVFFCLALVFFLSGPAWGEPKYLWKMATLAPDSVGWARQIKKIVDPWMDEVTNHELATKVYWGGIMGDDEDYVRKMHIGQLDGAGLSGQGVTLAVPEMAVLELPFLFEGWNEVDYVKKNMRDSFDALALARGYKIQSWIDQDFDQLYSTRLPLSKPEHFARSRFLTWYGPLEEEMLKALGANPIPVNVPEASASIRQGIVDSVLSPAIWMVGAQMYSVVRYVNPVRIRYSPALILVTLEAWNKLPEIHRKNILDTRYPVEQRFCDEVRKDNQKCLDAMIAYGLKKVDMLPQDLEEMKARTLPVWDAMAGTLYPAETLEELKTHLKTCRAEKGNSP